MNFANMLSPTSATGGGVAGAGAAQHRAIAVLHGGGGLIQQGGFHPAVEGDLRRGERRRRAARRQHRGEALQGLAALRGDGDGEFGDLPLAVRQSGGERPGHPAARAITAGIRRVDAARGQRPAWPV